eukprot:1760213-Prymnesium_polylepis.1
MSDTSGRGSLSVQLASSSVEPVALPRHLGGSGASLRLRLRSDNGSANGVSAMALIAPDIHQAL